MIRERRVILDQGIYDAEAFMEHLITEAPGRWKAMTKGGKKDLLGCFHLLARDGKQIIIFTAWDGNHEKMLTIAAVRGIAHEFDCTAVGIFHEAWMVNGRMHTLTPWLPPSKHPNRQEVLMLMLLTNAGSSNRTLYWPIQRKASWATLGDVIEWDSREFGWDSPTFQDILPRRTIIKQ